MIRKLLATVHKESLLLFRDREGILVLFLMPMALIVVMALIQHAPFMEYQNKSISLLYVDQDRDTLGTTLGKALDRSGAFEVNRSLKGKEVDSSQVERALRQGDLKVALILPKGATERTHDLASRKGKELLGADTDRSEDDTGKVPIRLLFDPVAKPAFRSSVRHFVDRFTSEYSSGELLGAVGKTLKRLFPDAELKKVSEERQRLFKVREERIGNRGELPELSSVQHNVPAWTVFGIFFIVVTMAGNMIREKNDGSAFRMKTLPNSGFPAISGKVVAYLLVSVAQSFLMLMVGVFLLPFFGLPAFELGGDPVGIMVVALATGFAATGFGVLIGSIFSTQQQATGFSAVSIVLLAAIGGVWVPLYVMPEGMQHFGHLSPLHWGLNAFNAIFIRASGIPGAFPELGKLLLSGALMITIARFVEKRRSF